ncbi:thioredoxin domain-containing protein [Marinicellulosiphila megalodicopiae]|uniref:thioredoxin domain-containing protein n=1 Tax=Marinicellulosiphila megalodicopiae TaxID=2724896 RepID=UPI003BAFA776
MLNLVKSLTKTKGPIFIGLFLCLLSCISFADLKSTDPTFFTDFTNDAFQGNPDARYVFIEYADYQCPYCQKFHQTLSNWIQTQDAKTLNVKWVYRQFPILGERSLLQSQTAICVLQTLGQNQFWQFSDLLFAKALKTSERINFQQSLWLLASKQGWDTQKLMQCNFNKDYQNQLNAFSNQTSSLKLSSTPSWFFIDQHTGKVIFGNGILSTEQLNKLISP